MTSTTADAGTAAPGHPAQTPQWAVMTRLFLRDGMTYLLTATLVMLACVVVGTLVAVWQGWQLVTELDLDSIGMTVEASSQGVTIVASLFLLIGAAGVAAVVVPVVLAARLRVYVAAGATRRSVAIAQTITLVVMTVYVLVLTAVVLLVVGRGTDGAADILRAETGIGVALATVRGGGSLLLAMVAGSAVVALFLRWPWWVGTILLTVLLVLLPFLTALVLGSWTPLAGIRAWWGFELAAAVVLAAVAWWMARRVPVR